MNPTLWLVTYLVIVLVCFLVAWWIAKALVPTNHCPTYRTISAAQLEADMRKLQSLAPTAPRPRQRAGQPAKVYSYPPTHPAQVQAQAVTAALRDIGGARTTANPYRTGTQAHAQWAAGYAQVQRDHQATLQA